MVDIDYLLIILPGILFVGVFGLILIIWHGNFRKKQDQVKLATESTQKSVEINHNTSRDLTAKISKSNKPAIQNDDLIILQVIAAKDRPYQGYELIQTLTSAGFHYGKMNIFHYDVNCEGNRETLFSLASAIEPGTFDLNQIGSIVCPGLCLFTSLNKVKSPSAVFEIMLETSQLLIQDLGGTLCDKQLQALTADNIAHYYSKITSHA